MTFVIAMVDEYGMHFLVSMSAFLLILLNMTTMSVVT